VTGSPTVRRRLRPLLGESVRVAASSQVSSTLLGLLALLTPLVVLTTAGFSIEGQAAVLRRLDEAGTRIVTVVSTTGEGVMPLEAVDRIGRLAGVSWVVGLGPVFDVRARAPAGQPTPLRTFRAVRAPISLSRLGASEPVPGTAYVSPTSARRLGLAGAYGTLDPGSLEVTGWFRVGNPLSALDAFVLVPASDPTLRLERIIVAAEDVGWVDPIVAAIPSLLGAEAAGGVTVEESEILRTARAAIRDELVGRDRSLVIAILVVATVLGAVVVFATTLGARRDFGRRRALAHRRHRRHVLRHDLPRLAPRPLARSGISDRGRDPGYALPRRQLDGSGRRCRDARSGPGPPDPVADTQGSVIVGRRSGLRGARTSGAGNASRSPSGRMMSWNYGLVGSTTLRA
jgi:putative ABC transport system permease protein